jgi:hypothetical protein
MNVPQLYKVAFIRNMNLICFVVGVVLDADSVVLQFFHILFHVTDSVSFKMCHHDVILFHLKKKFFFLSVRLCYYSPQLHSAKQYLHTCWEGNVRILLYKMNVLGACDIYITHGNSSRDRLRRIAIISRVL